MTIYEIKRQVEMTGNNPYYFDRKSMKFFGQTLSSFSVRKYNQNGVDGYIISAPIRFQGKLTGGYSVRFYNPITKDLEHIPEGGQL